MIGNKVTALRAGIGRAAGVAARLVPDLVDRIALARGEVPIGPAGGNRFAGMRAGLEGLSLALHRRGVIDAGRRCRRVRAKTVDQLADGMDATVDGRADNLAVPLAGHHWTRCSEIRHHRRDHRSREQRFANACIPEATPVRIRPIDGVVHHVRVAVP